MSNGGHQNSVATPSLWTRTALALALLLFLWTGWSLIAPSPRESPRSGALIARLDALQAAMEVLERESRQLGTRQTSAARWSQLFSAYRREAETLDLTDMDLGENADNLLRAYSYMSQAEEMRSSLLLSQFSEEHRRALEADFRTTIKLAITDVGSVIQGFRNTSAASEAGRRRALTRRLAVVCFLSCVLVAILLLQELKLVWRTRGKTRSLASPTWTDLLEKASFDGILTLDENALIRSFNPAAERIFGYSADEVVGQHLFQLIPSNSRTESDGWSLDERTAETASPEGFWLQVSGRRKDGATFPLDMRLFRVWDGLRFQFLGVFRDDSDRRRAMELSAECSLLGAVLELAAAPILVCDGEGRIVRFNRSCEDITGYSVDEVRSRRFWDFFWDAGVAEQARTAFASLDPESLPARMQQEWRTKDGGRQQIDWSLAALTGSDNAVEYVIAAGWPALERDAAGDEHSMEWAENWLVRSP